MLTRRSLLGAAALLSGTSEGRTTNPHDGFVRVKGQRFTLEGQDYRFVGTNMWYGAYLGAPSGDKQRLVRELDHLADLGITNIRVLGASEQSPLKNSIKPTFRDAQGKLNEDLLQGLDVFLAEAGKRNIRAVVYLNNFWEWTGGMVTYLSWVNGGHYIDMNDPAHPWPAFAEFSAQFYSNPAANALYRDYLRAMLSRRNTVTGRLYRDDPTIMAWQLANEPRPGGRPETANLPAFYAWISNTAKFIKALDPNHLVSTGNEGIKGCLDDESCVIAANRPPDVDYITFHIWPQNWSWIALDKIDATYAGCEANTTAYIASHVKIAAKLNKPLVAEEFGFPRDGGSCDAAVPVRYRDKYFGLVFAAIEKSSQENGPFVGSNFWAWGGEGRALHPDFVMAPGDKAYVGDPPQEPQGRNSVFVADQSTCTLIKAHARRLQSATAGK